MTAQRLMAAYVVLVGIWMILPGVSLIPAWLQSLSGRGINSFYVASYSVIDIAAGFGLILVGMILLMRKGR